MTRTSKLNDLQHILLATACQRDDGSLFPPADSISAQGDRIRTAVTALIKRSLAVEIETSDPTRRWRQADDRHVGVVITDAGRALIAGEEEPDATKKSASPPASPRPKPGSKIATVIDLLRRKDGATLAELTEATGWLPHTTRAALTGLRKKGHMIVRDKRDDITFYHISRAA